MKKIVAATAIIACLLSPAIVRAQTDPVSALGSGIAKIVAKALFGKAIGAVFGSDGLTKTELNNALAAHFKAHEMAVLSSRITSLKDAVATFNYNPKAELELVDGDLDNIFLIIHQIIGDIETHISAGNVRTLLPNYVFVTNVRLAFQAHKHSLDPDGGWDDVAAAAAADALGTLFHYYDAKFVDGRVRQCIGKSETVKLFTVVGNDVDYRLGWGRFLNFTGRAKYPRFVTAMDSRNPNSKSMIDYQRKKYGDRIPARRLCARKPEPWGFRSTDLMIAGINAIDVDPHMLPHPFYFLKKHIFKHPHHSSYYFTMPEKDNKNYFVPQGPFRSLESAREVRVMQAVRKYADWFGDVRGAAVAWYKLAAESHDSAAKNTAKQNGLKLGLISSSGHLIEK